MKKVFKIILINVILVILIFFCVDFFAYVFTVNKKEPLYFKYKNPFAIFAIYITRFSFLNKDASILQDYINNKRFRPVENEGTKTKKPILIFGCSFAYGYRLKDNETFSYQLGKLTGRPVYNRAYPGWAPQHMYIQLQNKNFYKIVPKPEYIIYVFIPNQIARFHLTTRITTSRYKYNIFYKISKNKLKRDIFSEYINSFATIYLVKRKLHPVQPRSLKYRQYDHKLLKLYFSTSKQIVNKKWGNDVKFIIILYGKESRLKKLLPTFNGLKKSNFTIININDLSDKNFNSKEYQIGKINGKWDYHPNAKAWEEITPLIVNKLNL